MSVDDNSRPLKAHVKPPMMQLLTVKEVHIYGHTYEWKYKINMACYLIISTVQQEDNYDERHTSHLFNTIYIEKKVSIARINHL